MSYRLTVACAAVALAACTSVAVKPVDREQHQVRHVCIQENPRVIVDGFLETVEQGLQRHGLTSERYAGDKPPEHCVYTLSYVARQNWDLAIYLWQAEVELRKGAEIVGTAEYHLRNKGGLALNKWASVESKIAPVLDELLASFPKI
jgi:hypothetical protein